jgi:hypothetical protein
MDIFISVNNREQVIKLPVLPKEFKVQSPWDNERYKTISIGEIKLIGLAELKSISIPAFFPAQDYPFLRDKTYKAWEYVEMIEEWRTRRVPIRLIITETPINMACTIDNFPYGPQDGSGDIYYTLELSEFKFPQLEKRRV